jgi:LmbE family N-acetylglucosaminyl deacetylase
MRPWHPCGALISGRPGESRQCGTSTFCGRAACRNTEQMSLPTRPTRLSTAPASAVSRALVVTAHPDDVDFGAAGTVAQWRAEGTVITYCVVTDGDAGGFDPAIPREQIPGIRRAEQIAAGACIGVTDVRFLGYRDGHLSASMDVRRDISRVIREVRPERVLIQSPERNWERIPASHPDHLAAGEAAMCAIYPDARNPFAHPELLGEEGLEAWIVPEVWLMGGPHPTHAVDVTEYFDAKIQAICAHESQIAHPDQVTERVREWLREAANRADLPEGRMAEMFQVVTIP